MTKKELRTLTQSPAYFETEYDSILWPPDVKSQLTRKDPDAAQDGRLKETETAEDETVIEHQRLNGQEFEQSPGDSGRQRSLWHASPHVAKCWT